MHTPCVQPMRDCRCLDLGGCLKLSVRRRCEPPLTPCWLLACCGACREPRVTEVLFKCATDSLNVVASVKEKATCSYVVVFYTPLICNHPAFQHKQDPVRNIECYPSLAAAPTPDSATVT